MTTLSIPLQDIYPLDFLRITDQQKLKESFRLELEEKYKQTANLSRVYEVNGKKILGIIEKLNWDSNFFNKEIYKIHGVYVLDSSVPDKEDFKVVIEKILSTITSLNGDYVFIAVDSRETQLSQALGLNSFKWIEGRSTYHRSLKDYNELERYDAKLATNEDIPSLEYAAAKMVNQFDRFHADSFFDPSKVDELMKVWVRNSIEKGFADFTITPNVASPKAFCTVKTHKESWDRWGIKLSQPVFSAVDTSHKGWYVKIISEICYRLKEQGSEHAYLITQSSNRAVVRVWEKLGFSYGRTENIFSKEMK